MVSMNIKDPEVHRMAHELAARRGTNATKAVRQALSEALAREDVHADTLLADLQALARRANSKPGPWLSDEDLYDEHGLPR